MAKEALNRIDSRKRERIFRNAAAEFARHGYHKANINSIAQRAGIAKGSIYLYFTDKLDLYCSTFREAARLQNGIFEEIEDMDLDPIAKIEKVLEKSLELFPRYRNMYKMYFDLTTSGNDEFLADMAQVLEKSSAEFFARILMKGIAAGALRKDLAIKHAAYVIDCVYSTFLATLASRYQKERFRVFTNKDIAKSANIVEDHFHEILKILQIGIIAERRGKRTGRRRSPSPKR
ncbi:MAG: TetR/AcrR family transcriptional regulator [Candidatus Abyssobacteria bacterium SURF_17]|jgi:AcrR family transcriptional regulator|uniref:TetR/AcrR family transcriptional regulator n=1 Tax=Candidatus Abyssobacteria bacterium SURF_17 TaxID=2093361 RepID=A0A419ESX8_9BACT|nr:MAG: TetR/AcrR family transcriptional regulator [Candidatus Abyssubacteria bacterium SURF_17]